MYYRIEDNDGNYRYNNKSEEIINNPSASAEEVLCSDAYWNNREEIADEENRLLIGCVLDMLAGGNGDPARKDFLCDCPVPSSEDMSELLGKMKEARMEVIADWFESVS
jgi:hypothetical protein